MLEREERKSAYLGLLVICRQMRTLSRPGHAREASQLDQLRMELSSATYEIDLIAAPDVSTAAQNLAQQVRGYLNEAIQADQQGDEASSGALQDRRLQVRAVVDQFIDLCRGDLTKGA